MRVYNKIIKKHRNQICALVFLGAFIPVILLMSGCSKKQEAQEIPPRPVQVAVAITKDVPNYIDTFGNLAAPNNVDIICQVTGKIKEVYFEEGQEVEAEMPLFAIDPREYQAELSKSQAALAADKVDADLKHEIFKRNEKLIEKKLISQQDFDTYKTDAAAAKAQVALDQAAVDLAQINLNYCLITSPIDGVTGKRLVDPGNIVTANSGNPLVNIKSIDPLYIDFPIPERKLPAVKKAMASSTLKVEISPAGDSNGSYSGELQMIDNTVDETTGTISLRASVPNHDRVLWPGQYTTVKLIVSTLKDAVLVPIDAVQLGQDGMYLYVITGDNKADLRDEITVGQSDGGNMVIEKGLKSGEKVVTSGQLGLSPGATVQIVPGDEKKGSASAEDTKTESETK
jgi:membrane fusion protein, multidrug efflux system